MPRANKHGGYTKEVLRLFKDAQQEEKEELERAEMAKGIEEASAATSYCGGDDCKDCSVDPQCVQTMERELGRLIEEVSPGSFIGCSEEYLRAVAPVGCF